MTYLIDTNVVINIFCNPSRFSPKVNEIVTTQRLTVSNISFLEIAIKQGIGKLDMGMSIAQVIEQCKNLKIEILQFTEKDLEILTNLPQIHRDPFDRLIIAQALTGGMPIITSDIKFENYPIKTLIY